VTSVTTLRVATYNTRDFLDDHRLAARIVRAVAPDILCLQEVLDVVFASPDLRVKPHRDVLLPDAVWAQASDHRATWVDLEV
jgi:endonuclease/exonuclease/phosphatase family metal-dependent hydrolase